MPDKETELLKLDPIEMPAELKELQSYAAVFIKSGMFDDITHVSQGIVKIMAGRELGIPPFAAMRGVNIIKGRPELASGMISMLIKKSGRYDYRVKNWTTKGCTIDVYELAGKDGRREKIGEATFNEEDARTAGLVGKDNWRNHPKPMYFARAISLAGRTFCPDIFGGSVYVEGEIEDLEPIKVDPAVPRIAEPVTPTEEPVEADRVVEPIEDMPAEDDKQPMTPDRVKVAAERLMDTMSLTPAQKIRIFKDVLGVALQPKTDQQWQIVYDELKRLAMNPNNYAEGEEATDDAGEDQTSN